MCENPNEMSNARDPFKTQLVACSKCNRKFLAGQTLQTRAHM